MEGRRRVRAIGRGEEGSINVDMSCKMDVKDVVGLRVGGSSWGAGKVKGTG